MSTEPKLQDLYRQTVLEHSRNPRHFCRMDSPDRSAEGHNPLCGDKITVYLRLDRDHVSELSYEASGCAISMASASIMSEQVPGLDIDQAGARADAVLQAFDREAPPPGSEELGDMAALSGVRAYPSRIRCALLPWRTLRAALAQETNTVTTESEH